MTIDPEIATLIQPVLVPIGTYRVDILAYGSMIVNTHNNPNFVGDHMLRLVIEKTSGEKSS